MVPTEMPHLSCAPNFRDLGGLPALDGGHVRHGRVYRSDFVRPVSDFDAKAVDRCGIGLVFDLRSASEIASHPNAHWLSRNVEVLSFDIGTDVRAKGSFWEALREDSRPERMKALIHSIYRAMPTVLAPALRALFDRLAQDDAPTVLLHCAAGKDRTGVAVALLLHALGVAPDAIEADYLETSSRVSEEMVADTRRIMSEVAGRSLEDASLRYLTHVELASLAQSWSRIESKYGSIDAFLETETGLDDAKRAALRAKLIVRPG